ncbi:hypothetical protein [Kordia jejudonensis]|uniref:hypothetical protein n=1 Tax=Kordia jejudonensis TaxID=1348245 RepID=UPI0012E05F51|nr:hypothetical protein [Kordia jejudonensis]
MKKLNLTKSRIAELNTNSLKGGTRVSTNPNCLLTGIFDGCDVTANDCPGTGGPSGNCGSNDPTCNTQAILSCLFSC